MRQGVAYLPVIELLNNYFEIELGALLGNEASLQPLKRLIFAKTNGNPFFMEETVQVLLDDGVALLDELAV